VPPPRCSDPHGLACASTATRRLPGHKTGWQACGECANQLEQSAESATDTDPMTTLDTILRHVHAHPGASTAEIATAHGLNRGSVSGRVSEATRSGLLTLKNGGLYLIETGVEAALVNVSEPAPKLTPASGDAVPAETLVYPPITPSAAVPEWLGPCGCEEARDPWTRCDGPNGCETVGWKPPIWKDGKWVAQDGSGRVPTFDAPPVADHQNERTTYADEATEEGTPDLMAALGNSAPGSTPAEAVNGLVEENRQLKADIQRLIDVYTLGGDHGDHGDPVDTDELCSAIGKARGWYDAMVKANVDNTRLKAEVADLTAQIEDTTKRHDRVCNAFGLEAADPEVLEGVIIGTMRELLETRKNRDALRARLEATPTTPAVRLEWAAWEPEDHALCTRLQVHFGAFRTYIAEITSDHGLKAKVFYTDAIDGEVVQVSGFYLAKIEPILSTLLTAAGLTMPPVPALPVAT